MWSDDSTKISIMREDVGRFIADREWGRYHAPVNVASALAVEAGELLELFQWRRPGDPAPADVVEAAGSELADVLHFTFCLANTLGASLECDELTVSELIEGSPSTIGGPKAAPGSGPIQGAGAQEQVERGEVPGGVDARCWILKAPLTRRRSS
jgi:NTP pyrophosphatase (non-canonical NTP hydrolase)